MGKYIAIYTHDILYRKDYMYYKPNATNKKDYVKEDGTIVFWKGDYLFYRQEWYDKVCELYQNDVLINKEVVLSYSWSEHDAINKLKKGDKFSFEGKYMETKMEKLYGKECNGYVEFVYRHEYYLDNEKEKEITHEVSRLKKIKILNE